MASAQTSNETRRPLDFYPTPPWYTNALLMFIGAQQPDSVLCPFAGNHDIVKVLRTRDLRVVTNDIHEYDYKQDFYYDLSDPLRIKELPQTDWVIDNPPYNLPNFHLHINEMILKANFGVAMLLRQTWVNPSSSRSGVSDRGRWLSKMPPDLVLTLPRYPFADNSHTGRPQTDACNHCWLVWYTEDGSGTMGNHCVTSEDMPGWEWRD